MPTFASHDGTEINYIDEGSGEPVVLVHGFAASIQNNWRAPRIIDAIHAAGRRVLALDCRGHGESAKPHDPAAYGRTKMGDDVIALMDHRGIETADLIGYSMGSFISSWLLVRHPERFRSVIVAGVGDGLLTRMLERGERAQEMANAMEAPDAATSSQNETARNFRLFAQATGNDLQALAAMQRAPRETFDPARLRDVTVPVLVLISEQDTLVGSGEKLAAAIAGARHVVVPGDHLSAVGQPEFRSEIVKWLTERANQ
jgi:pimeloyl-ACP methyl ester carboxylesterase